MKKIMILMLIATSLQLAYADVPVVNVADNDTSDAGRVIRKEATENLQKLIKAVSDAQNIKKQITELSKLEKFLKDPVNALSSVDKEVSNMLNNFNSKSGTNFETIGQLMEGLLNSKSATGLSIKLQQASSAQLQNISTTLQKMEAENQALIKYKQAEIIIQQEQKKEANKQRKAIIDSLIKGYKS